MRSIMAPRHPRQAARAVAVMLAAAAASQTADIVCTRFVSGWENVWGEQDKVLFCLPLPAALALAGVVLWRWRDRVGSIVGLPATLATVLAITVLDLVTRDATSASQAFFTIPVIYGSYQLRRPAAWITTAAALAGQFVVIHTLVSTALAFRDLIYAAAICCSLTLVIVSLREAHENTVRRLHELSRTDELTGLYNRVALSSLAADLRGQDEYSLILLDVDDFKIINDTHGHPVGDAVLSHIAGIIRSHCRPQDRAFRLGGDELVLVAPGCPESVAVERARLLREAILQQPFSPRPGVDIDLSVSVGVSAGDAERHGLDETYRRADADLYAAKQHKTRPASPGPTRIRPVAGGHGGTSGIRHQNHSTVRSGVNSPSGV